MNRLKNWVFQESFLVILITLGALAVAFWPFIYEQGLVAKSLSASRYPLFETEFPPDQRVYLSRINLGYQGQWLVKEKYTAEPHQPTLLHEAYLLMGKLGKLIKMKPLVSFPLWRLLGGAFMLFSGYYFLLTLLPEKKLRLGAYLVFILAGNWPQILSQPGIPLFGRFWGFHLGWYTFFDPLKRLVFYPHYTLASGFLALTMARLLKKAYWSAGLLAFFGGIILPQVLIVSVATLVLVDFCNWKNLRIILKQWPFWLMIGLCLLVLWWSTNHFPWNLQSRADITKGKEMPFNYLEIFLGLGPITLIFGLLAIIFIFKYQQKRLFLLCFWLIAFWLLVFIFGIFPVSNQMRLFQIDLHLPLAAAGAVLSNYLASLFKRRSQLIFQVLIFWLILPSFLTWPLSLKSQQIFAQDKVAAGYPLIPQLPYVVYPAKTVMEAIFWLGENTQPEEVVLAAETVGSMIPAYAGNTVYLGHGHQTVNFPEKIALMKKFYEGTLGQRTEDFLRVGRIDYVFLGPEETELTKAKLDSYSFLKLVFTNPLVKIYRVEL